MMKMIYKPQSVLFFVFLLWRACLWAQCDASNFGVTATNASCLQNGAISVGVGGASTCSGWNAILTRPDNSEISLAIPANGGPVNFVGLTAGSYQVRLFNGITTHQWGANPINLTTSYVNMSINSSATPPSCQVNSVNFSNDATLTINVPSGGIGPFSYSVTSSLGTQTFGPTASRTHTFSSLPGGETVAFTVVDEANSEAGCASSQTQTKAIANNTLSIFFEGGVIVTRKCRQIPNSGCNDSVSVIMRVRQTGAPIAQNYGQYRVNGGAWTTPTVGMYDNYHGIIARSGDSYEFRAYNNCDTIFRSGIFPNAPAKIMLLHVSDVPAACGYTYRINTDDQTTICLPAQYFLDYFNGTTWDSVSMFTTSNRNNSFSVAQTGTYRVRTFDGCDTIVRTITVNPATSPISSITIREGTSILAGTSSIYFNPLPLSVSVPLTVTITPLYAYTNPVSISATAPEGLAGNYTINFPYTKIFNNTGGSYNNHVLSDLPLGQYSVMISDTCGNSITRTVTLATPTSYAPDYTVNIGCANSNSINYNLNSNHRFIFESSSSAGSFELINLTSGAVVGTANADNMTFTNLSSGYYRLRASRAQPDAQHSAYPDNKYSIGLARYTPIFFDIDTIFVPPYQNIGTNVQNIACDNSIGSINVAINSGTPVYPLIYKLFDATGTLLIASDTAQTASAANAEETMFSNLAFGDYVLNIVSGYSTLTPNGCYSLFRNVTLDNNAAASTIQLADSIFCPSNINTQLGIVLDTAFWNISWTDILGNNLATNANTITVAPTADALYCVQFQLKSNLGCLNPPLLADTALVRLGLESTAPTISPIAGALCPNTNISISAAGGTSGTNADIYWYSGPNGTGSLLGIGDTIVIAPQGNTTIYARREGLCNASSDASTAVTTKYYVYATDGTSSSDYCTDNAGWQHFYVGDEIIYSVQGDISAAPAGFPIATIYEHGNYYQDNTSANNAASCANGWSPGEERFEMARSWDLNMGGGAAVGTYKVRFYYRPAERTAIENAANAWMATYPACGYSYKYATPQGFYWFKNSGASYAAPLFDGTHYSANIGTTFNGVNYSEWAAITGFSGGSGAIILVPAGFLPVEWRYFNGHSAHNINTLNWATEKEENTLHFELQRSGDALNFETIATIPAAGRSDGARDYHFDDRAPLLGQNYYRLRLVNLDLSADISDLVALYISVDADAPQFYPNPVQNLLSCQLKTDIAEPIQIDIIDILGRVLSSQQQELNAGLHQFQLDLSTLPAGAYSARLSYLHSGKIYSAKVIKN